MINHIIKSFIVGQRKDMIEQINDLGVYDFLTALKEDTTIDNKDKYEILHLYLRISNR